MNHPVRFLLVCTVMSVFLIAGIAKLVRLDDFCEALQVWTVLEPWSRAIVCVVIPPIELVVGLMFFLLPRLRNWSVMCGIGLTSALLAANLGQWFIGGSPDCSCIGLLTKYVEQSHGMPARVAILTAFLLILASYQLLCDRPQVPGEAQRSIPMRGRAARGFTLVEALVVVLLIAVIMALVSPSLFHVRRRVGGMNAQAVLRSHAQMFALYAGDERGDFPCAGNPREEWTIVPIDATRTVRISYFQGVATWPLVMAPRFFDSNVFDPAFSMPSWPPGPGTASVQSSATLAEPEFWNPYTRTGTTQWRGTRVYEVVFPSKKSILVDCRNPDSPEPVWSFDWAIAPQGVLKKSLNTALADGAVIELTSRNALSAYPTGEGSWPGTLFGTGVPGMHTIDGVRGRDLR